jgi:hypothetical protein
VTVALPPEWRSLDARIVAVPRLGDGDDPVTAVRARMAPALAMAHAQGRTIVVSWLRVRPNGRVAVLVGGVDAGSLGAEPTPFGFPAAARAVALGPAARDDAIARLPSWAPLELSLDARNGIDGDRASSIPGLDDLMALLPDQPVGLLVVGRPVAGVDLDRQVEALSDEVAALEAFRDGRGSERARLARAEADLAYLDDAARLGAWQIEVWVGAVTASAARGIAGLVAGCGDLADLPLRARPERTATVGADPAWRRTATVGADAAGSLLRPPHRELPGLRAFALSTFDVAPEVSGGVALGTVLDASEQPSVPFSIPLGSLNRHAFVSGATGAGKSQTVRTLLAAATGAGVPWMVIEPAKSEYAAMAGRLPPGDSVTVIRPGSLDQVPGSINPLEPSSFDLGGRRATFPLQTHLDLVRSLFTASFQAEDPFPQILAVALGRAYEGAGWNLALGRATEGDASIAPRYPTLADVQRHALEAVDAIGYGKEVRDNVQGFVRVRIDSLRSGTPGRFFEGGHPLDLDALLATNVVFEIEDLGDDRDKAFFIGNLLIRIYELLRLREAHGLLTGGLRHVLVVEEAHRLLHQVPEESAAGQAVTMFANLLAEVRAYGEGIVVAEQIPSKVIADVVKNSAVKIVHRLPASDDRDLVGGTMNLSEAQAETVVSLSPGRAAVHVDGMDAPVLVAVDGAGAAAEGRAAHPPSPCVGVRSPSCPSRCATAPCSLERLVLAQAMAQDRDLQLWAEIVVLGHLMGEPPGRLSAGLRHRLDQAAPEDARCALGLLADAAIDRRSRAIRVFYDPALLRRQVVTVLRTQWQDGLDAPRPDGRWAVASYRWAGALRSLHVEPSAQEARRPHPDTRAWRAAGLALHGSTWLDQRAELRRLIGGWRPLFVPAFLGEPVALIELAGLAPGRVEEALVDALSAAGLPTQWPAFRLAEHLEGVVPQ